MPPPWVHLTILVQIVDALEKDDYAAAARQAHALGRVFTRASRHVKACSKHREAKRAATERNQRLDARLEAMRAAHRKAPRL